jgi:hypothetical protein
VQPRRARLSQHPQLQANHISQQDELANFGELADQIIGKILAALLEDVDGVFVSFSKGSDVFERSIGLLEHTLGSLLVTDFIECLYNEFESLHDLHAE